MSICYEKNRQSCRSVTKIFWILSIGYRFVDKARKNNEFSRWCAGKLEIFSILHEKILNFVDWARKNYEFWHWFAKKTGNLSMWHETIVTFVYQERKNYELCHLDTKKYRIFFLRNWKITISTDREKSAIFSIKYEKIANSVNAAWKNREFCRHGTIKSVTMSIEHKKIF